MAHRKDMDTSFYSIITMSNKYLVLMSDDHNNPIGDCDFVSNSIRIYTSPAPPSIHYIL